MSFGLHVVIALAVIGATKRIATADANRPYVHAETYHVAPVPSAPVSNSGASGVQQSHAVPTLPPDVLTIAVPTGLESAIPPIETGEAIDPRRFVVGSAPVACTTCTAGASGLDGILEAHTVDQPVDVVVAPDPLYPAALKAAGVSGRVSVEFVVDTTGRVERGSIVVLESSAEGFSASVVTALMNARYRPALVRNRPVRQLVRQVMSFRID